MNKINMINFILINKYWFTLKKAFNKNITNIFENVLEISIFHNHSFQKKNAQNLLKLNHSINILILFIINVVKFYKNINY